MRLTPAEYVIRVFGGVHRTAKALDRSSQSISKWNQSRKKGGCEGRIPSTLYKPILNRAEAFGLDITHRDLIKGRTMTESDLALLDERVKKMGGTIQEASGDSPVMRFPITKPIDTEWFHDKIKGKHGSLRKFSKLMQGRRGKELDVAGLSLMLRGKRDMRIFEACQIAKLLNEPFMSILQHTGEDIPE